MPKTVYNQTEDSTYGWDDAGNFIGKQPGTPDKFNANVMKNPNPSKYPGNVAGSMDWKQFLKDSAVNLISQAPLAIATDGVGPLVLKGLGSLAAGIAADQLLNPQKSLGESAGDAALNTGVGMALPGVINNRYQAPTNTSGVTAGGKIAQMIQGLMDRMNISNYQPRIKTMMLQPKPGMLNQPTQVPIDIGKIIQQLVLRKTGLDVPTTITRSLIPYAANEGIDATVNSTNK